LGLVGLSLFAPATAHTSSPAIPFLQQAAAQTDMPAFTSFKGVQIGMAAADARLKLGNPSEKGDEQDFYAFDEKHTAQIYYDRDKKVWAVSVNYLGADDVPTAKSVMGTEIEAKPDGSVYSRVSYRKAGYWVSYNRTAGADPLITVTMQKLQ
jgi:hypothetical protein